MRPRTSSRNPRIATFATSARRTPWCTATRRTPWPRGSSRQPTRDLRPDFQSGNARSPPPSKVDFARMSTESPDWAAVERLPEFQALVRAKRAFIVPASFFFVVYYFALPVLVGYWPGAMSTRVVGRINVAYLFALSQFAMAWAL